MIIMAMSGVTDYKNTYAADRANGSRGYNNIAVSSGIVEKMAKDPATAAKPRYGL